MINPCTFRWKVSNKVLESTRTDANVLPVCLPSLVRHFSSSCHSRMHVRERNPILYGSLQFNDRSATRKSFVYDRASHVKSDCSSARRTSAMFEHETAFPAATKSLVSSPFRTSLYDVRDTLRAVSSSQYMQSTRLPAVPTTTTQRMSYHPIAAGTRPGTARSRGELTRPPYDETQVDMVSPTSIYRSEICGHAVHAQIARSAEFLPRPTSAGKNVADEAAAYSGAEMTKEEFTSAARFRSEIGSLKRRGR